MDRAFLTAYAETQRFTLGQPMPLAVLPDGDVLFRRTAARDRVASLYRFDLASGTESLVADPAALLAGDEILSPEERARRERTRTATRGVVDISVSASGEQIVVPLGQRVFLIDKTGRASELALGDGYPGEPRISPNGQRLAFVRDGNLWVAPIGGAPTSLTNTEPGIEFGVAEFVAQEELGRNRGYWWSPDSKQLLVQRSDVRKVDTLYVADPRHPDRAPTAFRYPRAGRPNAELSLALYAADATRSPRVAPLPVAWDTARYPYLLRVEWSQKGPLALIVANRPQTEVALLHVDVSTGQTRTLVTERDDAWVEEAEVTFLDDGTFLWLSERTGEMRLEHRRADGELIRVLSPDGMGVIGFGGVDTTHAWVTASANGTSDVVYRIPLAGGAPERMSAERGVASVKVKDNTALISAFAESGEFQLLAVRGDTQAAVQTTSEAAPYWPTTKVETVEANGLAYRAQVTRPRAHASGKLPVLLFVYGGPSVRLVRDTRREFLAQFYADAGFIVVSIDNRGTPGRGRAWQRAISGDLASMQVADQVAALSALGGKHPDMDLARVGVTGWSFGGTMSALLVMRHPELFKAAVVGAPVTDWSLYDSAYTERYLRTPEENPEGYRRSNPITYAAQLSRPMLLVHGTTDDNVYFAHAVALTDALYAAHKTVEMVPLSATHMVPDPALVLAREAIQLEFFRRHLAAGASDAGRGAP